jgi:hypothetical protein
MATSTIPRKARRLRTYAALERYLRNFVAGHYRFIWVVGRPGVSKSESVRAALAGRPHLYLQGGQVTALSFYQACFQHRGQPIVLDDAELLLATPHGRRQVAALGDTSTVKQMTYSTTSLRSRGVPPVYHTTSPLFVIANAVTTDAAILSRAVVLHFDPDNYEVHRDAARWFWCQEIHDWMGQHVSRLRPIDARCYITAHDDLTAGEDWRDIILKAYATSRALNLVQDLEADPTFLNRKARATRFCEVMRGERGASRATYYRLLELLQREGRLRFNVVQPMLIHRTSRPVPPSELELESLASLPLPEEPAEEVRPVDVSAREAFAQPIRGQAPSPGPHFGSDGTVAWEPPEVEPEEDED